MVRSESRKGGRTERPKGGIMTLRWLLASAHLLALGIGLGAVWARARALGASAPDAPVLRRAFTADTWWGIAGFLWIATGLWRLLAGTEKPTAYYMGNHVFWTKMALLAAVIVLEVWVATRLTRWRIQLGSGEVPDLTSASAFSCVSYVQAVFVILMVLAATAMARGSG